MRPNILKQQVAGIEVSGLFDLKKDHAVFAFDVSCIISRQFVNNTYVQGFSADMSY